MSMKIDRDETQKCFDLKEKMEDIRIRKRHELELLAQKEKSPRKRKAFLVGRLTQKWIESFLPGYERLLEGKTKRVPPRDDLIKATEKMEWTLDEQNDVLAAAGYTPKVDIAGDITEQDLERIRYTMIYLPLPSYIITRTWDIIEINEYMIKLLETSEAQVASLRSKKQLNILRRICSKKEGHDDAAVQEAPRFSSWARSSIRSASGGICSSPRIRSWM